MLIHPLSLIKEDEKDEDLKEELRTYRSPPTVALHTCD